MLHANELAAFAPNTVAGEPDCALRAPRWFFPDSWMSVVAFVSTSIQSAQANSGVHITKPYSAAEQFDLERRLRACTQDAFDGLIRRALSNTRDGVLADGPTDAFNAER